MRSAELRLDWISLVWECWCSIDVLYITTSNIIFYMASYGGVWNFWIHTFYTAHKAVWLGLCPLCGHLGLWVYVVNGVYVTYTPFICYLPHEVLIMAGHEMWTTRSSFSSLSRCICWLCEWSATWRGHILAWGPPLRSPDRLEINLRFNVL